MYGENNNGPRTVPCGTPDKTGVHSEVSPFYNSSLCFITKQGIYPPERACANVITK